MASIAPVNVDTPDTFTSSSSVCPSTSKDPLASIAPVKVEAPDTFTLSSSVCPSTSKLPPTERLFSNALIPTKVDIPVTLNLSISKTPPAADVTTILLTVSIPLTIASPRTSNSEVGSKIVVPIPTRPTTSNTFLLSVLPSIPIFCSCCLPLRNRVGDAILLL